MWAVVTGASTGIGKSIAIELAKRGYDLVVVARDRDKLNSLKEELDVKVEVEDMDLSQVKNAYDLYERTKGKDIGVLVNNAGYGKFGEFIVTQTNDDLNMVMLNVTALHVLTKLYLRDFLKKDKGYILNVSSSAGFMVGGPLMSVYYATKRYVTGLSLAIYEELRRQKSNVKISVLCPGPVMTNFNERAGVKFSLNSITPQKAAKAAIDGMFLGKLEIIPGFIMKVTKFMSRFLSDKVLLKMTYHIQHRKND